jgi:transcription antitermination factor NusG
MSRNWYAVHTLFNRELIAQEAIERKNLETFLPLYQERKADGVGKWKRVTLPLFPRYLFVLAEPEKLSEVKRLQGIAYVVSEGDYALSVPEVVIEEIRSRVSAGFVEFDDCPFEPDENVIINAGFAAGLTGVFKQWIPAKQKVGIMLSLLGREAIIQLDLNKVSPVANYSEL